MSRAVVACPSKAGMAQEARWNGSEEKQEEKPRAGRRREAGPQDCNAC